jgi:hypothetical protein
MKLSRWLVLSLVIAITVALLSAAAWWWVTWPERTARRYFDLVQRESGTDAAAMLYPPTTYLHTEQHESDNKHDAPGAYWREMMKTARFNGGESRPLTHVLLGQPDFEMVHGAGPEGFTVRRGVVLWPQHEEAWCRGHSTGSGNTTP